MEGISGEAAFMAASAGKAFLTLMDPTRLMFLGAGCVMGLVLGIVPGIGGLAGTAMLLPFTFNMDPYTAFALLLGSAPPPPPAIRSPPSCSEFPAAPRPLRPSSTGSRWRRRARQAAR